MKKYPWYQVDNLANIFLATVTTRDSRSLRIACTLKEEIDRGILQEALNETIELLPQFNVLIHRGFFWHYIDEIKDIPQVHEECRRVCPVLYEKGDYSKAHYEVTYYKNRINLDLLHAISDGTGAIEFMNFIVYNYLKRKHPDDINDSIVPELIPEEMTREDSYREFFENDGKAPKAKKEAYRPKGLKLPFDQLQFMEVHMPSGEIRRRAKAMKVTITSYIAAHLIRAFLKDMENAKKKKPVVLSLPVNLRKYYPSKTLRNFFNNIALTYKSKGDESLEDIAGEFDKMLKAQLEPENIKKQMNHFQKLQQNIGVRVVPLFLKQWGLKFAAWFDDRHVSAVLSNLGALTLPEPMCDHVERYALYCSSQNLFVCCGSFKDNFTIGITNPYINTDIIKEFIRGLAQEGIPVSLEATEVVK